LTNVRHNEDFHLLYPQFFQAVTNLAPLAVEAMIHSSLTESKVQGRVARSPLRLLFNMFLELQRRELLCAAGRGGSSSSGSGGGNNGADAGGQTTSVVFPDRVDWVEFLDFVKQVDIDELHTGDQNRGTSGKRGNNLAGVNPVCEKV